MKSILRSMGLVLAASSTLLAADAEYFNAVIQSSYLKELLARGYAKDILSIKHDQFHVYRCLGCYDFDVTIVNAAGEEETMTFQTEWREGDKIDVRRISNH
ncbi:MAG: hypothetical protein KC505_06875 [Myxococcales bacterium]|nr:hypothetical protein [Myxococcales bacterium]USN51326.1 MAG: hypothetical protein H6731_02660 [Myxococcales bacterium]